MSIDEFLDQYTPTELEKLDRADTLRRAENVGDSRSNMGSGARKISPIGTATLPQGRSPRRTPAAGTTPGRNSNRGGGLTPISRSNNRDVISLCVGTLKVGKGLEV